MVLKDDVKKLASKSKFWKYATATVFFVGAVIAFSLGMPTQGNQMIEIGKEAATVQVTEGEITGIVSATAPVSVTTLTSPTL